ncbi:MAG: glycoside hydrolase family 3 C-terminal domain-containing protein, partial [Eubacterium sp.]|nr:glycoside hydrolase family 3 C-terminal domain-containing protein [Eubacterium sp.]
MSISEKIKGGVNKIVSSAHLLSQNLNKESEANEHSEKISEKITALSRQAAAEGAVLLKNDGVLPISKGSCVSIFSRLQKDWMYVGYGSGGDVNCTKKTSLLAAARKCEDFRVNEELAFEYDIFCRNNPLSSDVVWGTWPFCLDDMPLNAKLVQKARSVSDTAIFIIGRGSGEDRDCALEKGSYYISDSELENLTLITEHFEKVVVLLNIGIVMDMSWVENFGDKISAILCVWQGGMESGNAVCDLLCGKVSPSGRLADTIARSYFDYPSAENYGSRAFNNYEEDIFVGYRYFESFDKNSVLYPFGFGLSYTDFAMECVKAQAEKNGFCFTAKVTNTGAAPSKEVAQIYIEKPVGKLGNPARELAAFAKTKELAPNESEELELFVDFCQLCSYDDCGSTNHAGCEVVEKGDYKFYLGKNARENEEIYNYYQEDNFVFAQHKQACAPQENFDVFHVEIIDGKTVLRKKPVAKQKYDLATRINNNMPEDIEQVGDVGYKLIDVKEGRVTMQEFVAQLSIDELEAITRGDYTMDSPLGAAGNAGACAGILESLRDKGVPAVITTDGPSGIRLKSNCSLIPSGTLF